MEPSNDPTASAGNADEVVTDTADTDGFVSEQGAPPAASEPVAAADPPPAESAAAVGTESPAGDELGLPEGVSLRSVTLPIKEAQPGGYMPGEIVLAFSPDARAGLQKLLGGLGAVESRKLTHADVINRVLALYA